MITQVKIGPKKFLIARLFLMIDNCTVIRWNLKKNEANTC